MRTLSFAIAVGSLAAGTLAFAATQVIGVAAVVVNSVSIRAAGAGAARPAAVRQRVALADQVQTGAASRLQLALLDRSVFTVGANARLTIDRFVYDPSGSATAATVAKGAFRFLSGGGVRRGGSAINTPVASIGIRGTILDGVVGEEAVEIARGERALGRDAEGDPATATLVVLRGPGARREGNAAVGALDVTAAGRTVTLDQPLLAAYVPRPGAAPIGPFTISLPGLARLNALIIPPREIARPQSSAALPVPAQPQRRRFDPRGEGFPGDFGGEGPGVPGGYGNVPTLPFPEGQQMPDRGQAQPAPTRTAPTTTTPPTTGRGPNSIP